MKNWFISHLSRINDYRNNFLFKNAFYLISTSIITAGLGFIFWFIAAKIYDKSDVGIAAALISIVSLILLISRLGLDQAIIRFLPEGNKNKIIVTSISVSIISTTLCTILFLLGIDFWTPELQILKNYSAIFLIITVINSIVIMQGMVFVAMREAKSFFTQNLIISSRILFLLPFVILGAMGIFFSYGLSLIIAFVFSIFLLYKFGIVFDRLDEYYLKKSLHFSIGNYIVNFFTQSPNQILPIMVLTILGPENTAQYYLAFTIILLIFNIPNGVSTSLFVEGSHGLKLHEIIKNSVILTFILLIPLVIIVFFGGELILSAIGTNYIQGIGFLKLMLFSCFLVSFIYIYSSILRIQKEILKLIFINGSIFISLMLLSYFLMNEYGLNGIAYAWLGSYGIGLILVFCIEYNQIKNFMFS